MKSTTKINNLSELIISTIRQKTKYVTSNASDIELSIINDDNDDINPFIKQYNKIRKTSKVYELDSKNLYHFGIGDNTEGRMFNIYDGNRINLIDISKNTHLIDNQFDTHFKQLMYIVGKGKVKFNQREPKIVFNYFQTEVSYNDYNDINNATIESLNAMLMSEGFVNFGGLLTAIMFEQVKYGVSYLNISNGKAIFLDQSNLKIVIKTDGTNSKTITYIRPYNMFGLNSGLSSMFSGSSFAINELKSSIQFSLTHGTTQSNKKHYKAIKAKHICVFPLIVKAVNIYKYIESPLSSFSYEIHLLDILKEIRSKGSKFFYSNLFFLEIKGISDITKSIKVALPQKTSTEMVESYKAEKNQLHNHLVRSSNYKLIASELISKISALPKDSTLRETLMDEINAINSDILHYFAYDTTFLESSNKRNEDVQIIELEDYYSAQVYEKLSAFKLLAKPHLRKVLDSKSIEESKIKHILDTFTITMGDTAVLTIEDNLKLVSIANSIAPYANVNEVRNLISLPSMTKKQIEDFIPAIGVEEEEELPAIRESKQNKTGQSRNQNGNRNRQTHKTSKN